MCAQGVGARAQWGRIGCEARSGGGRAQGGHARRRGGDGACAQWGLAQGRGIGARADGGGAQRDT